VCRRRTRSGCDQAATAILLRDILGLAQAHFWQDNAQRRRLVAPRGESPSVFRSTLMCLPHSPGSLAVAAASLSASLRQVSMILRTGVFPGRDEALQEIER